MNKMELFDRITEICTDIASANSDFYCTECLETLEKLTDLVQDFCGEEEAETLKEIIDGFLNEEED